MFNLNFFSITSRGIDLDYCGIEWFALETNRDHSVIFEISSKYCISDSFVDYDGYSISSKGFLLTVLDIMGGCDRHTKRPGGATPHPKSGAEAGTTPCLKGSGQEELPHV